jgi:HAD superfamily hydrolase (TIGR01458 family)
MEAIVTFESVYGNTRAIAEAVADGLRTVGRVTTLSGRRAVLLDLDGVLYVEGRPLPGAVAAVEELRAAGLTLRFVTNTTAHSRRETLDKLGRLGFSVAEGELVTPAALALQHCRERGHRSVALLMRDSVKEEFRELEESDEPDAVIVGDLGERFDYAVLNRAFRQLLGGAELIALQKNRYWLREDGLCLDVGPFVAALEFAVGREAHVLGKPAVALFRHVMAGAGARPEEVVMVGDDVESDVGGAPRAGLAGVLDRTGKYRDAVVRECGITPTATIDSIADLPRLLHQ